MGGIIIIPSLLLMLLHLVNVSGARLGTVPYHTCMRGDQTNISDDWHLERAPKEKYLLYSLGLNLSVRHALLGILPH